ncbi:MAG: S26 family signal peptidase [Nitrososphaeria archaeon]
MLRALSFLFERERIKKILKIEDSRVLGRRILFFIFLAVLSIVVFTFLFSKVVLSLGDSTPYRIFLKVNKEPELGDYVVIETSKTDRFAKGKLITKRVACVGGMYIKIVGLDYYCCNGTRGKDSWEGCTYLGKAKTQSKKGEKVIPYNPCGGVDCFFEVPLGYYFLVNPHPDSYDSRYLGPVGRSRVLFVLRPLG